MITQAPKKAANAKNAKSVVLLRQDWFMPGEIEKVAKFLGMKLHEFFKKYISIDYWIADEKIRKDVFVLSPAIINNYPGNIFPFDNRYGQCIFYKEGKCTIHPVKPYECIEVFHKTTQEEGNEIHFKTAQAWNNKKYQKQISAILCSKPKMPRIPHPWEDMDS